MFGLFSLVPEIHFARDDCCFNGYSSWSFFLCCEALYWSFHVSESVNEISRGLRLQDTHAHRINFTLGVVEHCGAAVASGGSKELEKVFAAK